MCLALQPSAVMLALCTTLAKYGLNWNVLLRNSSIPSSIFFSLLVVQRDREEGSSIQGFFLLCCYACLLPFGSNTDLALNVLFLLRKPISSFFSFLQLGVCATWLRRSIQQARFFFFFCCYACLLPFGSNTDPLFFAILLFQVKAVFTAPWFCNVTREEVSSILTLTHISAQQQRFVTFNLHGYLRFNIFTPKVSIFLQQAKKKNWNRKILLFHEEEKIP